MEVQHEKMQTAGGLAADISGSEIEHALPYEEDGKVTLKTKLAVFVSTLPHLRRCWS